MPQEVASTGGRNSKSRGQKESKSDCDQVLRNGDREIRNVKRSNQPHSRPVTTECPSNSPDRAKQRPQPKACVPGSRQTCAGERTRNCPRTEPDRSSARRRSRQLVRHQFAHCHDTENANGPY